jgi:hypothetical protein
MAVGLVALAACNNMFVVAPKRSVFMLFDASGSYNTEMPSVLQTSKRIVAKLSTGDWLGGAQISSCSFADETVIKSSRFPERPSAAMQMKEVVLGQLDVYAAKEKKTPFTDIKGALAGAAISIRQQKDSRQYIVVFSDLVEDLDKDCNTAALQLDLSGITVVASNVKRLKSDGPHPELYAKRLQDWEDVVTRSGGSFQVSTSIDDLLKLLGS